MHEMLQHLHESPAFARLQRRHDQSLRRLNRRLDVPDQAATRRRDGERFCASIDSAVETFDQLLPFQASHHVADGRAVESDDIAERRLIYSRMIVDGDESGILNRRDFEFLGLVQEQGKGNLLQPADEMAGQFKKAIIVVGHRHFVTGHSVTGHSVIGHFVVAARRPAIGWHGAFDAKAGLSVH